MLRTLNIHIILPGERKTKHQSSCLLKRLNSEENSHVCLWNLNRKHFKSELTIDPVSKAEQPAGPHRVVLHDVLQHEDDVCEGRPQGVRLQPAVTHDVKAAGSKGRSGPSRGVDVHGRRGKYSQPSEATVLCVFTYISGLHPSGFLFLWPMLMW